MQVDLLENLRHGPGATIPIAKLVELQACFGATGLATSVQEGRLGRALMIDHQQGTASILGGVSACLGDEKDVHAIVLVAHTLGEVVGLQAQAGEAGHLEVQSVACGMDDLVAVARGQHDVVGELFGHWLKGQGLGFGAALGGRPGGVRPAQGRGQADQARSAHHHLAAQSAGWGLFKNGLQVWRGGLGHGGTLHGRSIVVSVWVA